MVAVGDANVKLSLSLQRRVEFAGGEMSDSRRGRLPCFVLEGQDVEIRRHGKISYPEEVVDSSRQQRRSFWNAIQSGNKSGSISAPRKLDYLIDNFLPKVSIRL